MWYLAVTIYPVLKGRVYRLFIEGGRGPIQRFAELNAFFYPWQQANR